MGVFGVKYLIAGCGYMASHFNPMNISRLNLLRAGMYPRAISGKITNISTSNYF